jgi:Lhr-like helicase
MKGRSKVLIDKRNKRLVERYYFWTEVKRRRFDDVLRILSNDEFFISETRILAILKDNNDFYDELMRKKNEAANSQ